jgi:membrane protease YdiL (CAAX protease family)
MRGHPVVAYFILACTLSWLAVFPLIRHADISPAWHALGAVGPLAAALIMTVILGGLADLRDFAGRMTRWRVGPIPWLLAVSPIALCGIAIALLAMIGAPLNGMSAIRDAFADRQWLGGMFLASLAYGLGEEPGWRGFALPLLQRKRSALRATVLLSIGWGVWHIPYFFYRYHMQSVGEYVGFYVGLFAGALWLTFLYNTARSSILIVIVWHTVWNAVALAAAVISPVLVAVTSSLIMASGVLVLVVGGARLTWRGDRVTPTDG